MGTHVQTEDLRESGIGRAIMLLSKHQHETLANKKSAKTLIELWSRPIFNLSSKYKDMHKDDRLPVAEGDIQPTIIRR
jgi:transcription factor SPN1